MNYYEVTFELNPVLPAREVLIAKLSEKGYESFVELENGLQAYIPEPDFRPEDLWDLHTLSMDDLEMSVSQRLIEDENWNAEWEKNFEPIVVEDKLHIRAPFHAKRDDLAEEIFIEPKMSFGTGHHSTTYLIAAAMLPLRFDGQHVLDMGCGTGVLAILAEKHGAEAIDAIDIDEWAFENTVENVERNGCSRINVIQGGAEVLGERMYHTVLANINRNILVRDMHAYAAQMHQGATIFFSGFYPSDAEEIHIAARSCGLSKISQHQRNEWCMLEYRKD
jgi:ribosomal protein L11 methyltransferase